MSPSIGTALYTAASPSHGTTVTVSATSRYPATSLRPCINSSTTPPPAPTASPPMHGKRQFNPPTHDQQWTACVLEDTIFETSKHNKNLTKAQRELLQWQFRLGHIVFSYVHFLARTRGLPVNKSKAVSNCDKVKFSSCHFGKSSR